MNAIKINQPFLFTVWFLYFYLKTLLVASFCTALNSFILDAVAVLLNGGCLGVFSVGISVHIVKEKYAAQTNCEEDVKICIKPT